VVQGVGMLSVSNPLPSSSSPGHRFREPYTKCSGRAWRAVSHLCGMPAARPVASGQLPVASVLDKA